MTSLPQEQKWLADWSISQQIIIKLRVQIHLSYKLSEYNRHFNYSVIFQAEKPNISQDFYLLPYKHKTI